MTASTDRPRTKRQFKPVAQPSILSYFQSSSTTPVHNTNNPSFPATTHSSSYPSSQHSHHDTIAAQLPPLPAPVQASLLSVGMRVRKSVPEGYKTGKESDVPYGTTGGTAMSRNNSNGISTQRKRSDAISISKVQHAWLEAGGPSIGTAVAADFTSYCGIHKIGGYAAQPFPSFSLPPIPHSAFSPDRVSDMDINVSEQDDDESFGLPSSSQDSFTSTSTNLTTASTISTASMPPSSVHLHAHQHHHQINRKRTFQDTDPDPDPDQEHEFAFEFSDPPFLVPLDQPYPPSSSAAYPYQYPISHTPMPNLESSSFRVIARPKPRRKGSGYGAASGGGGEVGDLRDSDFEEAEFLMPLSDAAGVDVDMGGL